MKITDMHVTPIAITDPPLLNAAGLHAPYALRIIVELVTNDNIAGVGEIPCDQQGIRAAMDAAREVVIGTDPYQLTPLRHNIEQRLGQKTSPQQDNRPWDPSVQRLIYSAIEVACLDIIGKDTGRPVVDLLGGMVRGRVEFAAYLFYKYAGAGGELAFGTDPAAEGWATVRQEAALDPEGVVRQAQVMCKEFGFTALKLKGGVFEPDQEVQTILALREAFGAHVPLRLDPNAVWRIETAVRCGKKLEGVLQYFEDPVRGQKNMAKLRQLTSIPLATNMCTTAFEHLPDSIRLHSEDIILSDHHHWGGLKASVELGRICAVFGRGLSMHSNSHVGISLAAMVHLAAALPNLSYEVDTHYPWQREEVITGDRFVFEGGAIQVPKEPGLGIELDRQALQRLHEKYLKCGLTSRNDEIEMQKVVPGWKFQVTRW